MRSALALIAALAAAPAMLAAEPAEVRLLPGWREPDRHVAAVEIALPPGWHTYWRVPGAAGIAPQFDWSGSGNLGEAAVEWPHPQVFDSFGTRTIGYHDRVLLPVFLTPVDPGAPIDVVLTLTFGVCKDICIPAEARIAGRLAPDAPPSHRAAIEASLASRAHSAEEAGVIDATCRIARNGRGHALTATVRLASAPGAPQTAVIEAEALPDLWISEATALTEGATVTAEAHLQSRTPAFALDRSAIRLTLIDAWRTVDIEGCAAPR
jgi:DsbC/DsbD-like thiol-disulfide interchange protein